MSNLQAISRSSHATRRYKPFTSYLFAAADALAPLVNQELPKAMLALPIAFLAVEGAFVPMAVLGLKPGENLFVAQNGQWVVPYVPAVYRSYPFVLANAQDGKQVLCVHEDSGLVSDTEGEPFFTEDGEPTKAVAEVLAHLNQVAANRQVTQRICALLQKHHLIQPWPIKLQGAEGEQAVEGLFRIDEAALNQLSADALVELRDAGALLTAYCQLLSTQHLPMLGQLAQAHAKVDAQVAAAAMPPVKGKELDLSFLEGQDTLKFF